MKLAYREFGEGKPLIILHGLFGQSDNWNTLAKQYSEQGFRVFTIDQRNHGLSPHSDEWNYEAMADDLMEFIDEHGLNSPALIGHSMGGKTLMFFELKYPEIAERLIIADIAARYYEPHHNEVLKALHAVDFSKIQNRKEAEAVMNEYIKDFGTKQFLLKNIYWKDAEHNLMDWRFNLRVISANYNNISKAVPDFTRKTKCLVVRGERSNYVDEKDLEDFRKRFTNLTVETIPGAGHWVHAEKPKEFFEATLNFLKN